ASADRVGDHRRGLRLPGQSGPPGDDPGAAKPARPDALHPAGIPPGRVRRGLPRRLLLPAGRRGDAGEAVPEVVRVGIPAPASDPFTPPFAGWYTSTTSWLLSERTCHAFLPPLDRCPARPPLAPPCRPGRPLLLGRNYRRAAVAVARFPARSAAAAQSRPQADRQRQAEPGTDALRGRSRQAGEACPAAEAECRRGRRSRGDLC